MPSGFSLDQARLDTPGTAHVTHFNNAGSALPPQVVLDALTDHLTLEATIGGYEAAAEAHDSLDGFYESTARLLGAKADEIAFIENATRAWDMAVYGYPFESGDRVLVGRAEYVSNVIGLLQLQKRHGIELVIIEDDADGQIDLALLDAELQRGAVMVSLTHIPTGGGLINPAEAVGELCSKHDTFYVLDACQSAGQLPLDVSTIKCDVLSGTGRKYLRGPRGTGFLYVGPRALERIEPPFLDLHAAAWTSDTTYEVRGDARRFENWETNFAGKIGLGAAIDYALDIGIDVGSTRLRELGANLRSQIAEINGVTVHDKGPERGGIVTFSCADHDAVTVRDALFAEKINTSTTGASSARLDFDHRGLTGVVRASVHYYNSEEEVERFVASLAALCASA